MEVDRREQILWLLAGLFRPALDAPAEWSALLIELQLATEDWESFGPAWDQHGKDTHLRRYWDKQAQLPHHGRQFAAYVLEDSIIGKVPGRNCRGW
jgi:hypothetical protein